MMKFLDEVKFVTDVFNELTDEMKNKYLRFLPLTGRHAYFQQGYFGETSTIAVVDTGINPDHPELKGRVVSSYINTSTESHPWDRHGHGTFCAATVAGKNVGVAPKAKILSVKVLDSAGRGSLTTIARGLEAVLNWKDPKGRKVTAVSMSLSGNGTEAEVRRLRDVIKALTDADIPVICSAGNTGGYSIRYPSAFEDPITVGAVDVDKLEPAGFSTEHEGVDLCQVGVNVLGAYYTGGYVVWSGTSMSTPIVAGIVALIKDKHYQIFKEEMPELAVYWMLKNLAKDIGIPGLDNKTGAGFCTLQPVTCDLYTRSGDRYMTLNGKRVDLLAPVTVAPPGVTMLPARAFVEEALGGLVEWDPETRFGRFRV